MGCITIYVYSTKKNELGGYDVLFKVTSSSERWAIREVENWIKEHNLDNKSYSIESEDTTDKYCE